MTASHILQAGNLILQGNALEVLRTLPDKFFSCCVTSPPYFKVRIYPCPETWWSANKDCVHIPGDVVNYCPLCGGWWGRLGDEDTIYQYITNLCLVFTEVWRVLRDDGVLFCNLGDQYAQRGSRNTNEEQKANKTRTQEKSYGTDAYSGYSGWDRSAGSLGPGLRTKSLTLAPQRLAIALLDLGWRIAAKCTYSKINPLPCSVKDRPGQDSEEVLMCVKSENHWYNRDAVRSLQAEKNENGEYEKYASYLKTTWRMHTQPCVTSHSSSFPDLLAQTCILLSTPKMICECGENFEPILFEEPIDTDAQKRMGGRASDGGYDGREQKDYQGQLAQSASASKSRILKSLIMKNVIGWVRSCICGVDKPAMWQRPYILDPFMGSGVTAHVAISEGRGVVGIELSPEHAEVSQTVIELTELGYGRKELNRALKKMYPSKVNENV